MPRRALAAVPVVLALTVALLGVRAAAPASAHAADLFPIDDWLGAGLRKAGDVVLGPLRFGAREIARLLATIIGALADLLIPKSLVRAGLDGIRWLVQLPTLGRSSASDGTVELRMPHLEQLRSVLTWIGITLLPLGLVVSGARAVLAPNVDGDSPSEVFGRVIVAGVALLAYELLWGAATGLSRLLTSGLLGLPWVGDGVRRMLQTLVIGGSAGTAVAAEFVIPLLILVAGTALLGLLLVRVGLEVAAALLYVLGGLVLGLSVTGFGWRLLYGWLIAAAAIFALPLLWSVVFATGAALMLDADAGGGHGGFGAFVAQLYNVAAALAVFWVAIRLAQGVFRHAGGALGTLATTPGPAGAGRAAGGGGSARARVLAENATPAGLARFSQRLRGGLQGGAAAAMRAATHPLRHPVHAAQAASYPMRRPVQSTHEAAAALRHAIGETALSAAAVGDVARTRAASRLHGERHDGRCSSHSADARHANERAGDQRRQRAVDGAARAAASPPGRATLGATGAATGNKDRARPSAPTGVRGALADGAGPTRGAGQPSARAVDPAPSSASRVPPPDGARGSVAPRTAPAAGPAGSAPQPWWARRRRKRHDRDDKGER